MGRDGIINHSFHQGFSMGFTTFGFSDHIMQGIRSAGYSVPTPIQSLAIGPALAGKDIIGCAQTGTGKTAAFVLPMLHRLAEGEASHGRVRHPRALVLTPTRELAQQVQASVTKYGRNLTLSAVCIYGGASMDAQLKHLRRGADIIVATPGRLLDHIQQKTVDLSQIQVLVLDEADRMLDMGFIHDVKKIIAKTPSSRQTLLFSATLSGEINELAGGILRDPHTVEAGERTNPAETITQHFYAVPRESKTALLLHALEAERMDSVLVFSRTKHGADKICRRLERSGISSVAIHSNRTQAQRERALEGFKRGKFRVLVATDIAARGIDVTGISHVVNFDVPLYAEDYIHRIGRTGRAGAAGDAITLVSRDEQQYFKRIEHFVGKRFPVKTYVGFTPPEPVVGEKREVAAVQHRTRDQRPTREHRPPRRKKEPLMTGRKKHGPHSKMESYSSSVGWSNH
jgi:ATP-dependent RNA helicase RhlE